MGAGKQQKEQGYWPSYAYVEIADLLSGTSIVVTFLLVATNEVLFYESLFKVQFPHAIEFIVIPVEIDGGPRCSRLHV